MDGRNFRFCCCGAGYTFGVLAFLRSLKKIAWKALNFRFADKDKPTNVLSFPSKGVDFGDESLGDIAICPEIIIKEAIDQGKEKQNHLTHIILHSLLHLVGYVHEDNNSASKMESLEVKVLKKLGIANPY